MADVGSLGQYKVVVTADYSQLQTQFKAMMDLVNQTAKAMSDSLDKAVGVMNGRMTSQLNTMTTSMQTAFNGVDSTIKGASKSIENLSNTTARSGNYARAGSEGFKAYAAQVRAAEKAEQDFQRLKNKEGARATAIRENAEIAQRTAAHKAFWDEQVKQEKMREAEHNRNQQRIKQMQTQYNVAYAEINKYLQSHAKMSEAVFIRLQGKIQAITAEMQRLGAMPVIRNPLGNMNYADYEKQFGKFGDMMKSLKHHLTWMASAAAIGVTFGIPAKTISTIADVEKQMAAMKQVNHDVNSSQEVLNKTTQDFIGIAQKYGHSVDEIIKAGTLWGRQYKQLDDVMKLTNLSAKLAVADNMNIDLANRAVESVINGYQKQGEAVQFATHVVDSWTKIAHNAQSSATDLAEALMRTGAAAKAVGVDFDTTNALASAMIKSTGRSGAEVGNALKSLFSSIHSDKAIKQLQALGIEMYKVDEQGQKHFRNLHDVFVDLMITSHTTSQNMEKDLLAISGGKFQWSKVASVLGSYQDFIHAYGMSINSANFSEGQIAAQLDTISRKMEQLKATMTGIATGIGASGLSAYIKNILSSLNSFAQAMQRIPSQTYEMIGAFVKWGLILASSVAIIRTLVKGIYGIRAAYLIATTAQAANTASTTVNTLAKAKNHALSLLGINAARTQAAASVAAAGGLTAEAAATEAATVATGGFAATVTAATGGLNLILAAIAAAVVAFLGYNTVVGTAIEETDSLTQKQADAITAQEQNIQNLEAQKEFIGTLCEAHVKLQEALDTSKEGTEQHTKAEEDLKATDKELAEIIGEDAASNIDWSRNVQDVIKDEQAVFTNKINNEKQKLAEAKLAQLQYTQNQITWTQNRINALKDEGYGWNALKDVIEKFVQFLGGALVRIGESLKNLQDSIRETPILGKIAKMTGFGEIGSGSREALNSMIAAGNSMQSYSGQSIVDSLKNMPIVGGIGQFAIDHFYGTSGFFGSHSNRENELKYQEDDLKRLEKEYTDQKIAYYQQRVDNAKDNDSGIVSDDPTKGAKGGKGTKTPKGAQEADNSIEAMLYRHMTKALKLTHAQAVAELANIQQESGFNYQADNGTHKGLYQFDSNRWAEYQSWLANTGRTDSAVSQVDYRNLYESKYVPYEAQMQQAYLQSGATTPEEYAAAFNQYIERSGEVAGDVGYENRMRNARDLDKRFARRNGEENFDDVLSARENAYKQLYEQFDREVENLKTERAKIGQGVSAEEKKKIFEKIMGVGEGKQNAIFAEVEKAQKDYSRILLDCAKEEAKRAEAITKSTDTQVKAIEKMADAEIAFAEKLGLINKSDVRKYEWEKNESNYAKNKPLLDAKLGSTVDMSKGTADDMLAAYQGYVNAKTDLDAKYYAEKMFNLSRDVDATMKALNEVYKLEQSYYEKRKKINDEEFAYRVRYATTFIDSLTNSIQSGLEGILNRTKSFAEAFRDIFKGLVQDIIKLFSQDFAERIKKWLSNAILKPKATGNKAGAYEDIVGMKSTGGKSTGGDDNSFNLIGWAQNSLSSLGGGTGKGKGVGQNPLVKALGGYSFASEMRKAVQPGMIALRNTTQMTINGMSNITQQGMQTISGGIQTGTQAMTMTWQGMEVSKQMATEMGNAGIVANSQATAATVQATTAQMMGWIMAVLALFSLFGGGGSSTSESYDSVNLGRSPDSYYMTPTPVMQSTTFNVPSFDIGGNIEQDMFAMVHKNEMVLTPEQANVIRETAKNGGSLGGSMSGSNANIKSNIQVSTVDSRGFERVLRDYNRDLSKSVKKGIRNGYLTAKGLM